MPIFNDNAVEERVVGYIIRELQEGRQLFDVLCDPYVRNRFPKEQRSSLLEDPDLLRAYEEELRAMRLDSKE
ncbi:MAG: hypothetical protein FWG78_02160 [Coriobacteriia bacterium]|nr:hypothetical protein [Coriobacteriia bacterium]